MIKIGALSFINALPFFNPFIEKRILFSGELSFGPPTKVNKELQDGSVEIGLVSSATFIQNREKYVLLTNLGIGATKAVKSVCLYSKYSLAQLDGKVIAIVDASATSAMLLKVLCQHCWHITPKFVEIHTESTISSLLDCYDAALIIGDECLKNIPNKNTKVFDLAEEWYNYTHKPFVFSVFATRVDAWMDWPDEVREFHQKLVSAYDYSTANLSETLLSAQLKTGLSLTSLKEYYSGLDYYLDSNHFQGLEQFAALYAKCTL